MSGNVRIKICGIQSPEEAVAAVDSGADDLVDELLLHAGQA